MIDEIIRLINDGFAGIHSDEKIFGLTQRVYRQIGDGIDFMPGIVKIDGEIIYAGIDDLNSIMIYHRVNNAQLVFDNRPGYGDGRKTQDVISFSAIALWDTRKIKYQAPDILLLLRSRMPQEIRGIQDIDQLIITPTGGILNTKQVFDSEYSIQGSYLLPNFINLVQLNYNIQFKYDPQCMNKCIDCSK